MIEPSEWDEILRLYREPSTRRTRPVRVAVVDSGLDWSRGEWRGHSVTAEPGVSIRREDGSFQFGTQTDDVMGHGTAVAYLIAARAPGCTIVPVRILDEDLCATIPSLAEAIRWAVENGVDIINLSLGAVAPGPAAVMRDLRDACEQARERNVLVVAAQLNSGALSYPASFDSVVAVTCGEVHGTHGYFAGPQRTIDFVAAGGRQRVPWKDGKERFVTGASFACARMSGIAAVLAQVHSPDSHDAWRALLRHHAAAGEAALVKDNGDTVLSSSTIVPDVSAQRARREPEQTLEWIGKAALYPFNKEMHSLFRFRKHLSFEITGIGDVLIRRQVGKDPGEIIGQGPSGCRIVHRFDELFAAAETLIVGHLEELSEHSRRDLFYDVTCAAIERGLNVVSFVPLGRMYPQLIHEARCRGLHVHAPLVDDDSYWRVREEVFDPTPAPQTPVLGVFGTTRSQGKFTAQLALRYELMARGYRVAQLGTEPHSRLFGMDYAFPTGYHSSIRLPLAKWVTFLECVYLRLVRALKPDIFIFGTQSGILSRSMRGRRFTTATDVAYSVSPEVFSASLISGLKPDAAVLTVNSFDRPEHIARCIKAIESLAECPVVALTLSDQRREVRKTYGRPWLSVGSYEDGELEGVVDRLEDHHGKPVYVVTRAEGVEGLTDRIVDFFAGYGTAAHQVEIGVSEPC